jgi:AcrR family transcriptional regulator
VRNSNATRNTQFPESRSRRSDGERSRTAILQAAARLATIEGIDGLSIAGVADAVGMSKSGLFAHFGSKEELQLATIEAARETFAELVTGPAAEEATGLARLRRLCEQFLRYVEDRVYPGGCFFASVASDVGARRGPVRDVAAAVLDEWLGLLAQAARDAQAEGTLDPDEDPAQLAFELDGLMLVANLQFVLHGRPETMRRARQAIERRIASVQTATNLPSTEDPA